MRRLGILAILIVAVVSLAPVSTQGQEDETREIHVSAFSVGDQYWFEVKGADGQNPTIHLRPGERVQVTLDNAANTGHNIRFGQPLDQEMPIQEPGKQDTLAFQVPPDVDGESAYWCQPHRSLGMVGGIVYEQETGQADGLAEATTVGLLMMITVGIRRFRRRPAQPI